MNQKYPVQANGGVLKRNVKSLDIPSELNFSITEIYEPAGISISCVTLETEGEEYKSCRLVLNKYKTIFRVAKTTPLKIGQFSTIWQRSNITGNIEPFTDKDALSFVIIHSEDKNNIGQFIFNIDILIEKGIISSNGKPGKLAFRVYPPWSKPVALQAIKAQQWQLQYFFDFTQKPDIDFKRLGALLI